ncbi:alpha/beta hydrolase [Hydrogenophaga sp. Root209]|uniref:alpha/beta fold hydrolase n=1 Tax=Hydrogenophaga sp. Root209 TaxID=1736490 RepID=UPI0006F4DAB2|nr:alpha/beta hydrolase [Hydrogenophaga sp. Root209]KRC11933.1 alpha/beta hydrolase [Hydrogenophaga sp. Root209]
MTSDWFAGFELHQLQTRSAQAVVCVGGRADGPALVLLHGFPQTHAMWQRVARELAPHFKLVLPDLRGYGDSSHAPGLPDHSNYSKRAMAQDVVDVADALGIDTFHLCGHDRGGRVAHRLALDHPERVQKLCVIDIAPTLDMYARTDMAFARAYYHWFHLIQPAPLPELMIGGNAQAYLHAKLGGWGSVAAKGGARLPHIEPQALAEYERCFCRAEAIHSACEDYRASAGIDLDHDRESRERGLRIACDTLVLWGERGVVQKFFDPLALWQAQCAGTVSGEALPAGHFIPEELPEATASALLSFMTTTAEAST